MALITGGDSGIGWSLAVLCSREGVDVAIVHLPEGQEDAEAMQTFVEKEGCQCLLIGGELTDRKFSNDAVHQVVAKWDHLDVHSTVYQRREDHLTVITDEE